MSKEKEFLPTENPEAYRKRIELVMQTAEQVRKDFGLFDIHIQLSGSPEKAYGELIQQMTPAIEALMQESPDLFREMLYRIDIDERKLSRLLGEMDNAGFNPDLYAEMIVEREFKKVLTRHLFKTGRLK